MADRGRGITDALNVGHARDGRSCETPERVMELMSLKPQLVTRSCWLRTSRARWPSTP